MYIAAAPGDCQCHSARNIVPWATVSEGFRVQCQVPVLSKGEARGWHAERKDALLMVKDSHQAMCRRLHHMSMQILPGVCSCMTIAYCQHAVTRRARRYCFLCVPAASQCIQLHHARQAARVRNEFKIGDRRWYWIKVCCLSAV